MYNESTLAKHLIGKGEDVMEYTKKLANVDKYISNKFLEYGNKLVQFKKYVVEFNQNTGYDLSRNQKAFLNYKKRELEELLLEIEEDNIIFFMGYLYHTVDSLKDELNSIKY